MRERQQYLPVAQQRSSIADEEEFRLAGFVIADLYLVKLHTASAPPGTEGFQESLLGSKAGGVAFVFVRLLFAIGDLQRRIHQLAEALVLPDLLRDAVYFHDICSEPFHFCLSHFSI